MAANLLSADYVLPLADPRASLDTVGGKGASLARLVAAGLPVPDGFHVTTAAYRRFVAAYDLQPGILAALETVDAGQPATLEAASREIDALFAAAQTPPDVAGAIALAYAALPGRDPVVAVRSSATAEDLPNASFAGQQDTYLNVQGYGAVMEAVKRCWASLWTARAIGYRARQGIGVEGLSLAVVVQLLVPAEAAGILFTANPLTGRRDEAVLSAAWGLGEAVVGGLVTPDTLTVDKASGAVLERQIADKQVMTARVNGGTEQQPVPEALRHARVLDDPTAAELVRLGAQIEALYGLPVDIEWALADGALAIVQARPITTLPEPEVPVPSEWPMPDPRGPYMRGSVADLMPDPLTPLFRTVGLPALDGGMRRTLDELMGGGLTVLDGYFTTINDYVYMHLQLGCRDWLWVLFRMGPAIPRLLRDADRHWREVARPRYAGAIARWEERPLEALAAAELLDGVQDLAAAMADYLTALQVDTLGTGAGTEGLFTFVYDRLVRHEGDPPAPTLLLGADSLPIRAEKSLYDLARWCRERDELAAYLLATPSDRLAAQVTGDAAPPDDGLLPEGWHEWQRRFRAHLAEFGHSIYDLDFAKALPVDEPLPLLETLKLFIRGEGVNPHERQRRSVERREEVVRAVLGRVKGLKRRFLHWTLRLAQTATQAREDSIFDIGLGYPLLRHMLGELGRRFAAAGAIDQAADIYWLEREEVQRGSEALDRGQPLEDFSPRVRHRRAVWRAEKKATPPPQLPPKTRVMGVNAGAFQPVSAEDQVGDSLKGVAASPGQVTGTARVLHGPEDFYLMQPGDILVAEITTPAWTPLFAMAAGVVTNVGGPLSHGSIVAREYGVPAVLGTGVATQRIRSGQTITVDGSAGIVIL
ncbi:MAG: phosphoenolpyruvate synthase [Anaerolineaceae bacterium]|nr:phosphoenolpyruvate synthase [Anaerolineaceae bacterium]